MLKFVKHHMESIDGIEIFPIISFLIFFTFFVALTIYVLRSKESHIKEMKQMPLEDDNKPFEGSQDKKHQKNEKDE